MVFQKQYLPTRQIGYSRLPQVYAKQTLWKQPKPTSKQEKQMQRLREERLKQVHEHNLRHEKIRQDMQAHQIHSELQKLNSTQGLIHSLLDRHSRH